MRSRSSASFPPESCGGANMMCCSATIAFPIGIDWGGIDEELYLLLERSLQLSREHLPLRAREVGDHALERGEHRRTARSSWMKPSAICSPTRKTAGWMLPSRQPPPEPSRSYCSRCARGNLLVRVRARRDLVLLQPFYLARVVVLPALAMAGAAAAAAAGADISATTARCRSLLLSGSATAAAAAAAAPAARTVAAHRTALRRPCLRLLCAAPRVARGAPLGDGLRRLGVAVALFTRAARGHACEEVAASEEVQATSSLLSLLYHSMSTRAAAGRNSYPEGPS